MDIPSSRFVSKYWQLVEQFRKQIEFGILQPGDRLPSYTEMRTQFDASHPTNEKSYSILERDGLIVREPGKGTFVASPKVNEKRATIGFAGLSHRRARTAIFIVFILCKACMKSPSAGTSIYCWVVRAT